MIVDRQIQKHLDLFRNSLAVFTCIMVIFCASVPAMGIDLLYDLSFSHDSKQLLFSRCGEKVFDCQIQVYDLETGTLGAYKSPPNEMWTMARYSYDGKKIVFSVIPVKYGRLDPSNTQIAVMNSDGTDKKVITSGLGKKRSPVFSHSGSKVLYVKKAYSSKDGVIRETGNDAWEVNISTAEERRLTYYQFDSIGNIAYFPDDNRILFTAGPHYPADWPTPEVLAKYQKKVSEWKSKYGSQTVFAIRTDIKEKLKPFLIIDGNHVGRFITPLLSADGKTVVFLSDGRFYLYSPDGNHQLIFAAKGLDEADISPDGQYLGYIREGISMNILRIQDNDRQEKAYAVYDMKHLKEDIQEFTLLPKKPTKIINRPR